MAFWGNIYRQRRKKRYWMHLSDEHHRRSRHGPPPPLQPSAKNTNLLSIKFLYFFIISSLFPYFNLFVSIFIQSYVNSSLHVLALYILIIHKVRNSASLKIVPLLASSTCIAPYFHYVIQTRTCIHS